MPLSALDYVAYGLHPLAIEQLGRPTRGAPGEECSHIRSEKEESAMAISPRSGVAVAEGNVVSAMGQGERGASHLAPCPTFSIVSWLEGVLQAAGENESVENLLLGLAAAALCFLMGYAIVLLTKFQIGLFSIALG